MSRAPRLAPPTVAAALPADPPAAADVPLPPPTGAASPARAELLSLPCVWLARLPAPCTLRMRTGDVLWHVSTGETAYAALRASGAVVLLASELAALAYAAEAGRASRVWLAEWLALKRATPSLRLDAFTALGGVVGDGRASRPWPLGRVMHAWGSALDGATVGDDIEHIESV